MKQEPVPVFLEPVPVFHMTIFTAENQNEE